MEQFVSAAGNSLRYQWEWYVVSVDGNGHCYVLSNIGRIRCVYDIDCSVFLGSSEPEPDPLIVNTRNDCAGAGLPFWTEVTNGTNLGMIALNW